MELKHEQLVCRKTILAAFLSGEYKMIEKECLIACVILSFSMGNRWTIKSRKWIFDMKKWTFRTKKWTLKYKFRKRGAKYMKFRKG